MVAPASMAASTTCARNSSSVREASSGENSTSSQQLARHLHAFDGGLEDLLLRHVELVLAVDRARREEHVNAMLRGILQRLGRKLDIVLVAAGEAADDGAFDFARHGVDALPVAARGGGKPASITSTPSSASARATRSFPGRVMLQPGTARRRAGWCRRSTPGRDLEPSRVPRV